LTALTAGDEETINISTNSAADDQTITTLSAADLTSLNLSGSGDIIISNAITNGSSLATVDATGASGAVTVSAANSAVSVTMTANNAGAGVNNFTGGSKADTINGGGGADVLAGGAGADTIIGNGGADAITGGAGIDTLTGGGGVDNIELAAVTAAVDRDTVTDFTVGAGGDTLDNTNVTETATATADMETDAAAGNLTVNTASAVVRIGHTNMANFTDAAALDGTNMLVALGGTLTLANDQEKIFVAIDDGADTGIYFVDESNDGSAVVAAADCVLVAVLTGVADCTTLTFDNFIT
jgi:Ca2+-binding RTX toxin-like protein